MNIILIGPLVVLFLAKLGVGFKLGESVIDLWRSDLGILRFMLAETAIMASTYKP